jgi:anti-sigma-K factor RskA
MRLARDTIHALAAEYVVGTLHGRARRRFEAMARDDREVAAIVERWEAQLTPLAEGISPIEPPARLWGAIEARIAPPRSASVSSADAFWRTFGMLAAGLASVSWSRSCGFRRSAKPSPHSSRSSRLRMPSRAWWSRCTRATRCAFAW